MDQAEAIVVALKRRLKARGVTYAQLAKELGLSEASVKRIFAAGTLTLDRVARILAVLGITFQELARDIEPAGRLDEAGVAQLEKKVARLLAEYDALDNRSETPRQAPRQSICMMVAYRPFTISAVSGLLARRR